MTSSAYSLQQMKMYIAFKATFTNAILCINLFTFMLINYDSIY